MVQQPYDILNTIKQFKRIYAKEFDEISDYEKEFMKNIDPEGNPVLMIFNFKKF